MNKQEMLYSNTAEDTLLGSILTYPNKCLDTVRVSGIQADDFYKQTSRALFQELMKMADSGLQITISTAMMQAQKQSLDKEITPNYLTYLQEKTAPTDAYDSQIKEYVKTIKDFARRRKMRDIARCLQADAQDPAKATADISAAVQEQLTALESQDGDGWKSMKDSMMDYLAEFWNRQGGVKNSLQTGFLDIDKRLGGFEPGQLIILAARPAMGKTSLALNIATNVCRKEKSVLFVSQEMTEIQLMDRMMAALTGINASRLKNEKLTEHEQNKIFQVCEAVKKYRLNIFESRHTVAEIKARAQLAKAKFGSLDLIVIDHIQLIKSDARGRYSSRVHEVGEISHSLKEMAIRLKVPVLVLSQLSRATEGRDDKRPVLSDLRESGDIEQDADVVLGLHRSGYYSGNLNDNAADLGILKARDAQTGSIVLRWFPQFQLFRSSI